MKKRGLCLLLTMALLMTLTVGLAVSGSGTVAFDGGDGSRDNPYLISTAAQLCQFRDLVNSGKSSLCAQITENINLNYEEWTPIGLSSSGYKGTFDGCGYAIRNLEISKLSSGTSSGGKTLYGGGLFGIIGKGGEVTRVNVAGSITMEGTFYSNPDIGMICGGNLGTVSECFSTVSFYADMEVDAGSGHVNLGGIAGINGGTIRNCYTVGTIRAAVNIDGGAQFVTAGGIVGYTYQSGTVLENCYSAVTVSVSSNKTVYAGGVAGNIEASGTLRNLYANGDLCGILAGYGGSRMTDSSLLSTADMKTDWFVSALGSAYSADREGVNQGYPVLVALVYEEESDYSDWFEAETLTTPEEKEIFNCLVPAELKNKDLTKPITRLEFCAVSVELYEEMGRTTVSSLGLENPFRDTNSDAVKKAYALGITNGTSATTFDPYTLISREQLATMLTRVYKALNLPYWTLATDGSYRLDYSGTVRFDDDQYISGYAKPSVYFMVKNGVIKGVTATTFAPRNVTPYEQAIGYANASREQAIIMAVRMFQKL